MTHRLTIPGLAPTVNRLMRGTIRRRIRIAKAWRFAVAVCAVRDRIPHATGKRRVSLEITLGPRQRGPDPDNLWKANLDALVHAHLLIDDDRHHVELGPVEYGRGPAAETTVVLEDL